MNQTETRMHTPNFHRFLGMNGISWLVVWLIYALILVSATHAPNVSLPDVKHSDKWIHGLGYFVLMSFWCSWCMTWKTPQRGIIAGLLLLMLFAAADEFTQPWFNRHADFYDWCCDCIGLILSGSVFGILLFFRHRSRVAPEIKRSS